MSKRSPIGRCRLCNQPFYVPHADHYYFDCPNRDKTMNVTGAQMAIEDYKPRFLFEITEEQRARADKLIGQYGLRKAIFGPILDDVLDMIEQYGPVSIGALLCGKVRPRDVLPTLHKAEEVKDGKS